MKKRMQTDKLLFLNEDQVRAVLSYDDLIPVIHSDTLRLVRVCWVTRETESSDFPFASTR